MLCFNFNKKWIGLHFGRFLTNSSGHPERDPEKHGKGL
jgi:hypothetical protein